MFLFYYTLIVMLISAVVGAIALCVYIVTHIRSFLYTSLGFFFYFFDVSLVFRNDFLKSLYSTIDVFNTTTTPIEFTIFGACIYGCIWLVISDYLDVNNKYIKIIPTALFVGLSFAELIILPESNFREFLFFSIRTIFIFWTLLFVVIHYHHITDEVYKKRLMRHRQLFYILLIGSSAVLLENVIFLLIFKPSASGTGYISFMPERNIAENMLMFGVAYYMCKLGLRTLNLYYHKTPAANDSEHTDHIDLHLDHFVSEHHLSSREKEIVRLLLMGYSNQNIAHELSISPSTVKVHVHNVLSKTNQANRTELCKSFWMTN